MGFRRRTVLVVLGLLAAVLVPLAAAPPASAEGTVSVTVTGQGGVTGEGINCTQTGGPDCSEAYVDTVTEECDFTVRPPLCIEFHEPPSITLTAGPDSNGFVHDGWTGCESPSGRSCTHTVTSNVTITARYRDAQGPSVAAPTPGSGVRRGTVTLATTASDNAGVTKVEFFNGAAKLGEDAAAPYELSWNTATVSDGAKSITARAHDAAGNMTTSAASGFTVDNTAPTLSILSGPDNQTFGSGSTQTWSLQAHDATSVVVAECRVRSASSVPALGSCSGGVAAHSVANLPGGSHVFEARAKDAAGNTSAILSREFVIEDTPPTLSVTGPHGGTFGPGDPPSWTIDAQDPESAVTVECSVVPVMQADDWTECTGGNASHTAPAGLPTGAYTLKIRATNPFVTGGPVETRAFSIDADPPETTVTAGPADRSRVRSRTVTFSLGNTEPGMESELECALHPAGVTDVIFTDCTTADSFTATDLPNGTYVFSARATDPFGNTDATPVTRRFTVDTLAPRTTIRTGPPSVVRTAGRTARAVFSLASEKGARYKCKLDARKWARCTNRPAYTVGLGAHTLRVVAVDLAGNADRTPAVRRWTVRRR